MQTCDLTKANAMRAAVTLSLIAALMLGLGVVVTSGKSGTTDLQAQEPTPMVWPGKAIEATGWIVKFGAQSPYGQMVARGATSGGELKPATARALSKFATHGTNLPVVATGLTSSRAVIYAINEDGLVQMMIERLTAIDGIRTVEHYLPAPVTIGSRTFERLPQFTLAFQPDDPRAETLRALKDLPIPLVRRKIEDLSKALSRDTGIPLVAQMGDGPASLKIMFEIDQLANEFGEGLRDLPGVTYIQPANIQVSPFAG